MAHLMIGVVERTTGEIVKHQVLSADAGEDLIQDWRERLMQGRDPYEFTTGWWEVGTTAAHPTLLNKPTVFAQILRNKLLTGK